MFINFQRIFIISLLIFIFHIEAEECQVGCKYLPTYFSYNLLDFQKLSEKETHSPLLSNEELLKWDCIMIELAQNHPDIDRTRVYAYLYTAQKEAAFVSYNAQGCFVGSLGPISAKILGLFYPSVPETDSDEYSEQLADIVFEKLKERFEEENKGLRDFPVEANDPRLKEFPHPFVGIKNASYQPWILDDPKEFMAPVPSQNSSFWKEQAAIVKKCSDNCSEEALASVKYWAGKCGSKSGNWLEIANQYMVAKGLPYSKVVFVRSVLAQAAIDTDISLFYSKYSYLIKRPSVTNAAIQSHIPIPRHPSYPSGHSTWAPVCALLFSYYFPEQRENWFSLAKEAGNSRICAGIHYPIDNKEGWNLGMKLGNAILQSPKVCL